MALLARLRSGFARLTRRRQHPPLSHQYRPTLEQLEGRDLLSTTGVYDLLGPNANWIPTSVLNNPNVDGIALRSLWKTIETADGVYNWSYFDKQIAVAANAGKMVSLSVTAGIDAPSWLYQEGAAKFTNGGTTIPVPWDPVFLNKWEQFVVAFGNRYDSNPAVSHVKLTGINWKTQETRLPSSSSDVSVWQSLGYTRAKVESAWGAIAATFAQSFPDKQLSLMIVADGFPPLDNNGAIMRGTSGDYVLINDLINTGIASYGSQLIVQNNGLSDFWISQQVENVAGQVATGYQMLWWVTGDTTYKMNNGTPIDAYTELQTAVNSGIAGGATFLEVYNADLVNPDLQDIIAYAHQTLG